MSKQGSAYNRQCKKAPRHWILLVLCYSENLRVNRTRVKSDLHTTGNKIQHIGLTIHSNLILREQDAKRTRANSDMLTIGGGGEDGRFLVSISTVLVPYTQQCYRPISFLNWGNNTWCVYSTSNSGYAHQGLYVLR